MPCEFEARPTDVLELDFCACALAYRCWRRGEGSVVFDNKGRMGMVLADTLVARLS